MMQRRRAVCDELSGMSSHVRRRCSAATSSGRWRALVICLVGGFMVLLDVSIVNVALPAIRVGLGASPSTLQRVISGYALTFGLLMVVIGLGLSLLAVAEVPQHPGYRPSLFRRADRPMPGPVSGEARCADVTNSVVIGKVRSRGTTATGVSTIEPSRISTLRCSLSCKPSRGDHFLTARVEVMLNLVPAHFADSTRLRRPGNGVVGFDSGAVG